MNYFIAFISYAFILLVEKVAFDSHALIDTYHHNHEHYDEELSAPLMNDNYDSNGQRNNKHILTETRMETKLSNDEEISNIPHTYPTLTLLSDDNIEEQTIKNIITPTGNFASYLQNRNLSIII